MLKAGRITINPQKIFIAVIVIVTIISSGYALANVWNFHISYAYVVLSFLMLLIRKESIDREHSKVLLITGIFILGVLVSFCISGFSKFNAYFSQIFVCVLAFQIAQRFEPKAIINVFVNTMLVIAVVSIVFHIAVNFLGLSLPLISGPQRTYGNAWAYVYLNGRSIRNCGLFWEPCIFASYLALALMFINFEHFPKKTIKVLVLITAIITTYSSTGFVLLAINVIFYLLSKSNKEDVSITKKVLTGLAVIVLVFILVFWDQLIMTFFSNNTYIIKLLSDNISTSTRYKAVWENLDIFMNNPILGVGIQRFDALMPTISFNADTATSITMLSKFGIFGLAYTLLIIKGSFNYGKSILQKILVLVLILIVINTIPHETFLATWIIIFALNRCENSRGVSEYGQE